MKSKSIKEGPERVFVLILGPGEDAFKAITGFADRERIDGASVTAIGAFSEAKVGWFDLAAKKYTADRGERAMRGLEPDGRQFLENL
jgi:hypothetical protein